MIKLGLSIFEEEGAADDDLPPLDEVNDNNDTNAKMEEVDWKHWSDGRGCASHVLLCFK